MHIEHNLGKLFSRLHAAWRAVTTSSPYPGPGVGQLGVGWDLLDLESE